MLGKRDLKILLKWKDEVKGDIEKLEKTLSLETDDNAEEQDDKGEKMSDNESDAEDKELTARILELEVNPEIPVS